MEGLEGLDAMMGEDCNHPSGSIRLLAPIFEGFSCLRREGSIKALNVEDAFGIDFVKIQVRPFDRII